MDETDGVAGCCGGDAKQMNGVETPTRSIEQPGPRVEGKEDVGCCGDPEAAVRQRYSKAAQEREAALCCPVDYDPRYLDAIPAEVIQRDYGCGNPSAWLGEGDTCLDLGSGAGKICFIASQIVGPKGRVIGVDSNAEMLDLARWAAPILAERIGYANVEFLDGRIQDLSLDPRAAAEYLAEHPVTNPSGFLEFEGFVARQRYERPLIADASVDVVLSNCVLNLVRHEEKKTLFSEIYRVTKPGGRAVIADIASSRDVPAAMQRDPELWSGCISGALEETRFLTAFADAGFEEVKVLDRSDAPWRVVEGIEFRSLTVEARRATAES
ncbi:MAG: methyltransferase domain-containing protein [Candidatus Binatia bacterium]